MEIRIATTEDDMAACFALRREVFIEEQGVDEALEFDGEEERCTHILAVEDGYPLGTARFQYASDQAKIQRVCVSKRGRGKGTGAKIIRFAIAEVVNDGRVSKVRLGAQCQAIAFYEKLGFAAFGDVYMDAGIPHRDMELSVR